MQISVKVGRTFRGVYREVGIMDAVPQGQPMSEAFSALTKDAGLMLIQVELDTMKDDQKYTGSAEAPAAADELVFFDADMIEPAVHNGKKHFKVKGGQFSKFGVTCWPEVMKKAGIDVPADGLSGSWRVGAQVKDGKVLKVVSIE